jgi:hypothetical protein
MGIIDKAAGRVQVIYRLISELKLDPKNPRAHSPRQVRQIARSIDTFGFNVPVLIDANGKVIAGHGRILSPRSANESFSICNSARDNRNRRLRDSSLVFSRSEMCGRAR